jgi:hypothetical protein
MRKIGLMFGSLILISSCTNSTKTNNGVVKDTTQNISQVAAAPVAADSINTSWIDSFKDFRQALLDKNKTKLKSFFSFPLKDEGSSIWHICALTEAEANQRNKEVSDAELFYERDFDKYYSRIFDQKFLRALLKVKSATLYNKHVYDTQEFSDPAHPYVLHTSYDEEMKTLQLNMAFRNAGTDENGEYVSEGEYNVVYVFDVVDGKSLMFRKIVVAG